MSGANDRRWATALAALDANLLVALDALLQEANVTRAARRVGVTQSAMSQTLARLRHQFDDPILVRVGRAMEPSPFGLRIKPRLQHAIGELEAVVRDRPTYDPRTASTRFVVATVDYLAMVLTPPLHQLMAREAPGARLAIHGLDAEPITARLARGAVHLYVGVRGQTERALETAPLFDDTLCVLMRARHPLAKRRLDAAAYVAHPHVHVSPRREDGSLVERALAAKGLSREVAIEVPYFAMVPPLLAESDLLATVPARIAARFAKDQKLAVREYPLALPPIGICMAWHPTFAADPAQRWLREAVARVV